MGHINFSGGCRHLVLVIFTVIVFSELTESCHRRVEYHHHPKRPPPHHHHHKHHKGHHHHKPHRPHGHHHHHHHGNDFYPMPHGVGGGHGGGSYHNQHKGYGHGHQPMKYHGHHGGGYGHGGHGGHMGGGYHGGDSHGKGHQHGHGGHGHDEYHGVPHEVHGGDHGGGHKGLYGGHNDIHDVGYGLGGGHQGEGGHGGHGGGYDEPKGHSNAGYKGQHFKYHMFQSMQYDDKDGHGHGHGHGQQHQHQPISHSPKPSDYEDQSPVYMQEGYGNSGPYPNVAYSSPVVLTSMRSPTTHHPALNSFNVNVYDVQKRPRPEILASPQPQLDAADTADLIRKGQLRIKETPSIPNGPIISHHPQFDEATLANLYSGAQLISGPGNTSPHLPLPTSNVDVISGGDNPIHLASTIPVADLSPLGSSISEGNFDMNLNFNSERQTPFRRNGVDPDPSKRKRRRRRKKISRKYRLNANPDMKSPILVSHHRDYLNNLEPQHASQTEAHPQYLLMKGGSDYLETDFADDVDIEQTTGRTQDYMNF